MSPLVTTGPPQSVNFLDDFIASLCDAAVAAPEAISYAGIAGAFARRALVLPPAMSDRAACRRVTIPRCRLPPRALPTPGLPGTAGLYSVFMGPIAYAVIGSSPQLVTGASVALRPCGVCLSSILVGGRERLTRADRGTALVHQLAAAALVHPWQLGKGRHATNALRVTPRRSQLCA